MNKLKYIYKNNSYFINQFYKGKLSPNPNHKKKWYR